jgi:thymidylate synthase (FAD)
MSAEESHSIEIYGDGIGRVELIQHYGDDKMVVNSARVSFGGHKEELDDRDKKLIKYLIKNRHTSTLEHCGATFKFVVPLFVRSQHHRHRTWSYNEISRRYTDKDLSFYEPTELREQHPSNRQASTADLVDPLVPYYDADSATTVSGPACSAIRNHHKNALLLYEDLIRGGVCREQARGVLPQNLYTEYYGTVNCSNLLKFIDLRLDAHAQLEIQRVAAACLEIATDLWPVTVGAYRDIKND